MDISSFGKTLILFGVILIVAGAVFMLGGKLSWFGRLPGDIYIHKKNFTFFFPLTTSILISLILSALFFLLRRR
jgi:membrane protein implicated in regulation of membrane protease activity